MRVALGNTPQQVTSPMADQIENTIIKVNLLLARDEIEVSEGGLVAFCFPCLTDMQKASTGLSLVPTSKRC